MVNDNTTPPPNPMPLESLFRFQVLQYVVVACLTLCIWDWILALSDEYEMIRQGDRRHRYLWYMVYLVSRTSPIIYLVAVVLLAAATVNTCKILARVVGAANIVIMPAASGLFFIRLTAVYVRDKYIMAFFGSSWLAILGLFLFDSSRVLLRSSDVPQSPQCLVVRHVDAWGYIATAVYDTLMYLAISWQLASFATVERWQDRLRSFVTGRGLGWLSKVLLRSGQTYYFITITFSVCTMIFIYSPSIPSEWSSLFMTPNVTVASIMACRLFRELKLGRFVDPMTERAISKIVFRDIGTIPRQESMHTTELPTLEGVGADTGTGGKRGILGDRDYSDVDIELQDGGSRMHG